jgi:RNA polymerase sigma factor (TIGR02999 family)
METFTRLMNAHNNGDREATAALFDLLYSELRQLALRQRSRATDHTLSATGLVHEAFLKLQDGGRSTLNDRQHFFRLAKQVMRQVITDYARERNAEKRGGNWQLASLEVDDIAAKTQASFVLDLDDALEQLADVDQRLVDVVEFKYFVGLDETEIAEVLGVSVRTVQREWRRAKQWLEQKLSPQ